MGKEVFVLTFLILLSSTVESTKPIKKVLSLVKEIKKQMVTVDELTEIKNQIVEEVVDAINPTIAASCSCCNDITKPQYGEGDQGINTVPCKKNFVEIIMNNTELAIILFS